jgi:hypothetical protein
MVLSRIYLRSQRNQDVHGGLRCGNHHRRAISAEQDGRGLFLAVSPLDGLVNTLAGSKKIDEIELSFYTQEKSGRKYKE